MKYFAGSDFFGLSESVELRQARKTQTDTHLRTGRPTEWGNPLAYVHSKKLTKQAFKNCFLEKVSYTILRNKVFCSACTCDSFLNTTCYF
jgi:hypothetical protein